MAMERGLGRSLFVPHRQRLSNRQETLRLNEKETGQPMTVLAMVKVVNGPALETEMYLSSRDQEMGTVLQNPALETAKLRY
tara:strand:- start:842 stop:1084 length:243 start_codon:yes stop_codon:yes gene_type:complete